MAKSKAKPDWRAFPFKWLNDCRDLTAGQKTYWMYLNDRQGVNKTAWPQQDLIAQDLGVSERTLRRWNDVMESLGYLIVVREKMKHGPNKGVSQNVYKVDHPWNHTSDQSDIMSDSNRTSCPDQSDIMSDSTITRTTSVNCSRGASDQRLETQGSRCPKCEQGTLFRNGCDECSYIPPDYVPQI